MGKLISWIKKIFRKKTGITLAEADLIILKNLHDFNELGKRKFKEDA
jgi:hypothetical protein